MLAFYLFYVGLYLKYINDDDADRVNTLGVAGAVLSSVLLRPRASEFSLFNVRRPTTSQL